MKIYLDSFRFDIFIAVCLGGQFFTRHSVYFCSFVDSFYCSLLFCCAIILLWV